jgi:acyl-CoA reductase-like NAD-dependent aldehyde dehydrogenase
METLEKAKAVRRNRGERGAVDLPRYRMTIAGKRVDGASHRPVVNPATARPFALVPECSRVQLDGAMEAARGAFTGWSGNEQLRRDSLSAAATVIREHSDELAALLTREQGKPLSQSFEEVQFAAVWLD